MTDDKKADEIEDFDWDEALAEWEEKSFAPEVARDIVTDKPAALAGSPPPRPLYRPPTAPATAHATAVSLPLSVEPLAMDPDEDDGGATIIAVVPEELLRRYRPGGATSSHGGLGQMFARDPLGEAPHSKSSGDRAQSDPPDVVTSAQSVPSRDEHSPLEPLRRARRIDASEGVPDGAMFDPFAEGLIEPSTHEVATEPPSGSTVEGPRTAPLAAEVLSPSSDSSEGSTIARRTTLPGPSLHLTGTPAHLAGTPGKPIVSTVGERAAALWPDERPGDAWLEGDARKSYEDRAAWLEEEARAFDDRIDCARGLLVCSELLATLGDRGRAQALAAEARELAPSVALAHRQARALMPWPPDPDDYLDSLDGEMSNAPPGPPRLHSALLAAEAVRARGDHEGANARLEQAAGNQGDDVRAAVLRAASALAHHDNPSAAVLLQDLAELAPLANAIAQCLRLRGIDTRQSRDLEPSAIDSVLRARHAIGQGDLATAASTVAELVRVPELASGARWLAAALASTTSATRRLAVRLLGELVEGGDAAAHAPYVARALELGDRDLLLGAVLNASPLTSVDRVVLATLAHAPLPASDARFDAAASTPGMHPLVSAASAVAPVDPARYGRTAGSSQSRVEVELGRRLAAGASNAEIETVCSALPDDGPTARGIALELWARTGRAIDISRFVESWGSARFAADSGAIGHLAAALLAERAGARERAAEAFKSARAADPTCEAAFRALASIEALDQASELNTLADELGDGLRSALARIEAVARSGDSLPDPTLAHLLELAYRAAPTLPIAPFLAERIARRAGDADEVLRWIRERRSSSDDPIEGALESVREALLIADRDPELAEERLRTAHLVRRGDAALRDLFERMATDPPEDSAPWREERAAHTTGDVRVLLSIEAAHEFERRGEDDAALRCATVAAEGHCSLGRVARERAELRTGRVALLADALLTEAKDAPDGRSRREAYERLAVLDATARHDSASALLWHRSVLEIFPEYPLSLRHVEQHLIGEGRAEEIEPVAASIARALRGDGAGECTAHAEVAARLRLRADIDGIASAREMIDLAASESGPSLWALRVQLALARAQGDDVAFLEATKHVVARASRPFEIAALLVRAGEAAIRLDRLDEARSLVERASAQDPGDILAWNLVAQLRNGAGDVRGAAEATEALARCSAVPEHQLMAWYDAGRLWMDHAADGQRAMHALETAGAIDLAHADVFDRLAVLYTARGMHTELGELLQRRLEQVTDPEERLALEVRRGRVLLEVGEIAGARRAFEAALQERPDDPGALSAFADICTLHGDWEAAEQALVRLTRLLASPQEQRAVYERLGDLYSHRLVNLSRAEVALKEVLKRAPDDVETARKLVEVHKRQNDPARAIEVQQDLVLRATSAADKRDRVLELAAIHERSAHDLRRAEKTLEMARRDAPQDVVLLRALAEFYVRHQQTPAVHILLDRAAADARRALLSGRVERDLFEIVAAVFELRVQPHSARAVLSIAAAIEGHPADIKGGGERALDAQFDDSFAPDVLTPAIRSLLAKTGDALDAAAPVDLRQLRASPLAPDAPLARLSLRAAAAAGLGGLQVLSSPKLGAVCIPIGPSPAIVLGEALTGNERVGAFLALRAIKLLRAKASALARSSAAELGVLLPAWLKAINPTWEPHVRPTPAMSATTALIQAALPRHAAADVGILALEATAAVDDHPGALGLAAVAWSNRVALLAVGDPSAAFDAIALVGGLAEGAPRESRERGTWVSRTLEARDLVAFAVGDSFAQARFRLGLNA
ncbi:MAG: tetratricopeptide repeat protein [Polyangiaceae bacterium]|jgi:tetratricopeptide (TPR) repeat protein